MTIYVRKLNNIGISIFSAWIENATTLAPVHLLNDEATSEILDNDYEIDISRKFSTTYELGEYLSKEVFGVNSERFSLLANHGIWAWLSLAFIGSLCKRGQGGGAGKPLAPPHYVWQNNRLAYRLITRTAWDLVTLHGEAAKVALGSSKSPWGEMAEQMTARQEIYANRSFWPVASALYTKADGSLKKGSTSQRSKEAKRDPKNKSGLGGVRRLPFTFRQFERTYNLRRMTRDEITMLLPAEYERWRND